MITLRDYQRDCGQAIVSALAEGVRSQLIVLYTGGGKTQIFANLRQFLPDCFPMLVLAHRDELIEQARDKIAASNPDLVVAIEKAAQHADDTADVVVASVQTLGQANGKRIAKFNPSHFRVVVIDEAHHAAAPTYGRVLDYFGDAVHLGFTATPQRGDGVRLTDRFTQVVFFRNITDGIDGGWLAPLRGHRLYTSTDLSTVRIVRGDYAEDQLAEVVDTDARNQAILDGYRRYGENRKAVIFCVNVAHAEKLAELFTRGGVPAAAISGATDPDVRKDALERFRSGELRVLTNVYVLTEGWDEPSVGMVILARPSRSTVYVTQAIGRGTRLHPDKADCLVLDITDQAGIKPPLSLPTLMGLPPEFDCEGELAHEAAKQYKALASHAPGELTAIRSLSDIEAAWSTIDLFKLPEVDPVLIQYSTFFWLPNGEGSWICGVGNNLYVQITENPLGTYTITSGEPQPHDNQMQITGLTEPVVLQASVPELADAFATADEWIRTHHSDKVSLLNAQANWRSDAPTDKQIKYLKKFRVPITADLTKGQASYILDRLFASNPKKELPDWLKRKIAAQKNTF